MPSLSRMRTALVFTSRRLPDPLGSTNPGFTLTAPRPHALTRLGPLAVRTRHAPRKALPRSRADGGRPTHRPRLFGRNERWSRYQWRRWNDVQHRWSSAG